MRVKERDLFALLFFNILWLFAHICLVCEVWCIYVVQEIVCVVEVLSKRLTVRLLDHVCVLLVLELCWRSSCFLLLLIVRVNASQGLQVCKE